MRIHRFPLLLPLALVSCAPILPSLGGSDDARAAAAMRSAVANDTAFVTVAGSSGFVAVSAPPYQSWAPTPAIVEPVPLGLNSKGDLFVGEDQPSGHLDELVPPYAGSSSVGALSFAIGIVVDKHDDVWVAEDNHVQEYSPPSYRRTATLGHPNQQLNYPQQIAALPSGQLAVGRTQRADGTVAPGALDIYTQSGAHHFTVRSITGIPYPQGLVVDKSGDIIVAECSRCVSAGQTDNSLLMISPPYKSVTKVLQELPNVTLEGMSIGPTGDLFVNENGSIVKYTEPFTSGHRLPHISTASALHVNSAGDLIYIAGGSVYVLKSPYTGKPHLILSTSGTLEQIVTKT